MSQYYTETYKNYYDKLTAHSPDTSSIEEKILELEENAKKLESHINGTTWKELAKTEVQTNIVPKINSRVSVYIENITNSLLPAAYKANNELYPLLKDIKAKDEEYDALQNEINANLENGVDTSSLKSKQETLAQEMQSISSEINKIVNDIKSLSSMKNLDGNAQESISKTVTSKAPTENEHSRIETYNYDTTVFEEEKEGVYVPEAALGSDSSVENKERRIRSRRRFIIGSDMVEEFLKIKRRLDREKGIQDEYDPVPIEGSKSSSKFDFSSNKNVKKYTKFNKNWVVVDTKFGIDEYQSYAYSKGIRQDSNSARYGDLCLAFSYVHASNLKSGSKGDNAETAFNWGHAGEFKDYFSDSKSTTLKTIYNEITKGNPVILQVNGNQQGTCRHFVTVVGFKDTVSSASQLKESDLLILDSWDGQIETMDSSSSRFMTTGSQTGKSYSGYYLRICK